jgi:nitronate monooxygenase
MNHAGNRSWHSTLGLQHPVIQAGMGGGLSTSTLASAVSLAGGLGTVGLMPPAEFNEQLRETRERCGTRPFAANLLMPFVREAHVRACLEQRPAVVVMFYGYDATLVRRLQQAGIQVWHQIGTPEQAVRALNDGADALIAQGVEAGGHLAGALPLPKLIAALAEIRHGKPVLAAGGIHDAESAARAHALGVDGVVAGTRFLMTPESNAHPDYLDKLLRADQTLRTLLFGLAWPAYHRVATNQATDRWCRQRPEGPRWVQWLNTLSIPLRSVVPLSQVTAMTQLQRLSLPFYSAAAKTKGMDRSDCELTPLYAGTCVAAISELTAAASIVQQLAEGFCGSSSFENPPR